MAFILPIIPNFFMSGKNTFNESDFLNIFSIYKLLNSLKMLVR